MSGLRFLRSRVLIGSLVLLSVACSDSSPTATDDDRSPSPQFGREANLADQAFQQDRKDTRWQRMTDTEITGEVQRAGGRVIVGLKHPAAVGGVDNLGRVLVSEEATREARRQVEALGVSVDYQFEGFPVVVATVSGSELLRLRSSPYVDYVEPSVPGEWSAQITPWNVTRVQAPTAWSQSTGSGVKLIVIDSGIMQSHPDLTANVQFRCLPSGLPIGDQLGHGTFVNGVVAAHNNSSHVVGVAHGVQL